MKYKPGKIPNISKSCIDELLIYNSETGEFFWKVDRTPDIKKGDLAGCIDIHGYRIIGINRCIIKAHRLVWFYVNGYFPEMLIDHINGNKSDNRIDNLREVDQRGNTQNQISHRAGRLPGVTFHKRANKWQARFFYNRKHYHIGLYSTELEAHVAYLNTIDNIANNVFTDSRYTKENQDGLQTSPTTSDQTSTETP